MKLRIILNAVYAIRMFGKFHRQIMLLLPGQTFFFFYITRLTIVLFLIL